MSRHSLKNRKRLADLSDAFCIEAYRLNHEQGEGCAMISGYGDICSYQTANAAINRGKRLLDEQEAARAKIEIVKVNA